MATGLYAFRDIRLAPEAGANGTKIDAATHRLLGTLTMPMGGVVLHRPSEERGSLANQRHTTIVGEECPLTFEGDLLFDSIIYLCNMGIEDIDTPVGASAPYSWSFDPDVNLITSRVPKSMTFQFGNNIEQYDVEYCIARQLQFSGRINEPCKMRADIFGRNFEITNWNPVDQGDASIDPDSTECGLTNKCRLYIDATTVAPGTNEKAATLLGFTMTIDTGYRPVVHGGSNLFFDSIIQKPPKVTLEVTAEFNTIAEAQRAIFQAGTRQNFQITVGGTGTDYVYLMMSGVYTRVDSLAEEDGLETVRFTVESEFDTGLTTLYRVAVSNSIATLA